METRYRHVEKMAQEGLLAQGLCDPGTFNLSVLDEDGLFAPTNMLYRNDMHDSRYYVEACRRLNIGLSISIFEPGFLKFILAYHKAGKLPPGGILKFYFAADFLPFGMPPTVTSLEGYLGMLGDCDLPWLVSAFGDDCVACGIAEEAIKRGGHVQVGLEPYGGNRQPTNVELVNEVSELSKQYGRPIATPAQAAKILKLPTYPVPYERHARCCQGTSGRITPFIKVCCIDLVKFRPLCNISQKHCALDNIAHIQVVVTQCGLDIFHGLSRLRAYATIHQFAT